MKEITILLLSFICFSCSQKSKTEVSSQKFSKDSINQISSEIVETKKDTLPLFDTTIFIKSAKQKADSPKPVSRQMVIDDLYAHFKKEGYFIENIPSLGLKELEEDEYPSCIDTDSTMIHLVDLNNDNQLDAIVEYWLFPCGGSGHCYQPSKSIMTSKKGKFILEHENFMTTAHTIENIEPLENETIIHGHIYDCGNRENISNSKIHLKHSN